MREDCVFVEIRGWNEKGPGWPGLPELLGCGQRPLYGNFAHVVRWIVSQVALLVCIGVA